MTDTTNTSTAPQNTSTAPQKRRGRPVDPNGGLFRARTVFASMPDGSTRKETIAKFESSLGLTPGTAAAYYSIINRVKKAT